MHEESLSKIQKGYHGSLRSYIVGFCLSVVLTAASFLLAGLGVFKGDGLKFALIGLAVIQGLVQVLFFLHLGKESKPRWETMLFFFMVMVLFIVVLGTLWIMHDLDMRVMPGM